MVYRHGRAGKPTRPASWFLTLTLSESESESRSVSSLDPELDFDFDLLWVRGKMPRLL